MKFLDDEATYLGNQLECEFGGDRYFGVRSCKYGFSSDFRV